MKAISKLTEPKTFTQHKTQQYANFDNINKLDKDALRTSLLNEQGHICCYCMKRIPEINKNPDCKIEHFLCQQDHSTEALNYKNMLLACSGQQGSPEHLQTCDTKKGNKTLTFSPANKDRNIEDLIKYLANGEIDSDDEILREELTSVLNLNDRNLKENRRIRYEETRSKIIAAAKKSKGASFKKFLQDEKARLLNLSSGKFDEFCMVGVYVIDKKLKKII